MDYSCDLFTIECSIFKIVSIINMVWEIIFGLYLLIVLLVVIFMGFNYYRIEYRYNIHPQVAVTLLPFLINYILAKFVFVEINAFFTTLLPCVAIYFIGSKFKGVRIFGLTGGIACGKSTLVKQITQNLPISLIDCDQITRDISNKGFPGYNLILSMLGDKKNQYLSPITKQIERKKFSDFVFQNPQFRKQLTRRMGIIIYWQIFKTICKLMWAKKNLIMIDAPILYETKRLQKFCFPIIVIGCSREEQVRRLETTRQLTKQQAEQRIDSQMSLEIKKKKADIYVQNNGTPEDMFKKVLAKLNKYLHPKKK